MVSISSFGMTVLAEACEARSGGASCQSSKTCSTFCWNAVELGVFEDRTLHLGGRRLQSCVTGATGGFEEDATHTLGNTCQYAPRASTSRSGMPPRR